MYNYMCVLSHQSCLTLTTLWTVICQAPPSMGILQARILEWVAMPSSKVYDYIYIYIYISVISSQENSTDQKNA